MKIQLLGEVMITLDGRPLTGFRSRTAEALFLYLACREGPQPRQTLADFLWDERAPRQAAANLRTILTMLRKEVGDYLIITRQTVTFDHTADYWLDVVAFEQQMVALEPEMGGMRLLTPATAARLAAVLDLYRGDFLTGFHLDESRGFEEWTVLYRERLRLLAIQGLGALVEYYLEHGQYAVGTRYAERLITLDPYNERARRQVMWLMARDGRRNAALQQYRALNQLLAADLDVAPSPTTTAVYERIAALAFPPPHNLPPESAPFVGREVELAELDQLLSRSDCRLLTIVGPGGMGKTRLALELARRVASHRPGQFLDGIHFISLTRMETADFLTAAAAELLGITFQGGNPSQQQLFRQLRDRELLLVLDNFEHLRDPAGLGWLTEMLSAAPAVRLLVTSRERLGLYEEHLYDLPGLDFPADDDTADPDSYSAVRLFKQTAERVGGVVGNVPEEAGALIRICRLVEGMPLGLELAATATRRFSCEEILVQIEANLDFSGLPIHNRPARHQTLRAVFEHSWALLTDDEQAVAQRFAVFQGPFDLAAAEAITGATAAQVAELHDKSFLRRQKNGRYDFHPLIRQFLAHKLGHVPMEQAAAGRRHATYYAGQLARFAGPGLLRHYREILEVLGESVDNSRAALQWAVVERDYELFYQMIASFNFYFRYTAQHETCRTLYNRLSGFLRAGQVSEAEERAIAILEQRTSLADIGLHDYERARARLGEALKSARRLEDSRLVASCLYRLATIALYQGQFEEADRLAQQGLVTQQAGGVFHAPGLMMLGDIAFEAGRLHDAAQHHQDAFTVAQAHGLENPDVAHIWAYNRGRLAHRWGNLRSAQEHLTQALSLCITNGAQKYRFLCRERLGWVLVDRGEYSAAAELLASGFEDAREMKNGRFNALAHYLAGWLAECRGNDADAQRSYQRALAELRAIDHQMTVPFVLTHLGRVQARLGAPDAAATDLHGALATFERRVHPGGMALARLGLGTLYREQGLLRPAQEMFKLGLTAALDAAEHYFAVQLMVELALLLAAEVSDEQRVALPSLLCHPALTARDATRLRERYGTEPGATETVPGGVDWMDGEIHRPVVSAPEPLHRWAQIFLSDS